MPLSNEARLNVVATNAIHSMFGPTEYVAKYDPDRLEDFGLPGWTKAANQKVSWADARGQAAEKWQVVKRLVLLQSQWKERVCNVRTPTNDEALFETFEIVSSLVSESRPSDLDVRGLQADAVNGEHLVALLRASYLERANVPGWDDALTVAREALVLAHLPVEDHLEGLA